MENQKQQSKVVLTQWHSLYWNFTGWQAPFFNSTWKLASVESVTLAEQDLYSSYPLWTIHCLRMQFSEDYW
jgi:hypothetical protein